MVGDFDVVFDDYTGRRSGRASSAPLRVDVLSQAEIVPLVI